MRILRVLWDPEHLAIRLLLSRALSCGWLELRSIGWSDHWRWRALAVLLAGRFADDWRLLDRSGNDERV